MMINSEVLRLFSEYSSSDDKAIAVAVIQTLTDVVTHTSATTIMGLEQELNNACDSLKQIACVTQEISLTAGCELFRRYVTRTSLEIMDFSKCRLRLQDRGLKFAASSLKSRERIAQFGQQFIQQGSVILVHGYSQVVVNVLQRAARQGTQFSVLLTEGRSHGCALKVSSALIDAGIPITLILDAAVAFFMNKANFVLIGAHGVVENGGIINTIGTYQVALIANASNVPVYAAAESYTFTRLFPLSQRDLPGSTADQREMKVVGEHDSIADVPSGLQVDNPTLDYTPPHCITLLLTDLGILTPSAVSDELIKLFY